MISTYMNISIHYNSCQHSGDMTRNDINVSHLLSFGNRLAIHSRFGEVRYLGFIFKKEHRLVYGNNFNVPQF